MHIDFIANDALLLTSLRRVIGKLNRIVWPHLVNESRSKVLGRRCTAFSIML